MAAVQKNQSKNAVMGTVNDNGRNRTAVVEAQAFEETRHKLAMTYIDDETKKQKSAIQERLLEEERVATKLKKARGIEKEELERQQAEIHAKRLKLEEQYNQYIDQVALQRVYENNKHIEAERAAAFRTQEEKKALLKDYYEEQERSLNSWLAVKAQKEAEVERQVAEDKKQIQQQVEAESQARAQSGQGAYTEEEKQRIIDERVAQARQTAFDNEGIADVNRQIESYSTSISSAKTEMERITKAENKTLSWSEKNNKAYKDYEAKRLKAKKLQADAAQKQSIIDAKKAAGETVTAAETAEAAQASEAASVAGAEASAAASAGVWGFVDEQAIKFINGSIRKFVGQLDGGIEVYTRDVGRYNARMTGAGLTSTFLAASKMISTNLGLTGVASQKETVENLKKLADLGVAYNIEQRAFLQSIAEDIAGTFDAFDSNLLRIIRLQQADTTASRLGMKADMVQMFNQLYQDTSYMNNTYENVMANLIDSTSQMTRNQSIEFEYNVQKWLGSLSSLGISNEAINSITTGINYLASGNAAGLANNSALSTLFGLSASRAGLDLGKLLTGGMTGETVNALLESMVRYLKQIAEGENNLVVKQAFGNVLGLSMADFRAIYNMTESNIKTIANATTTYDQTRSILTQRIGKLRFTIPLSEQINTMMENISLGTAEGIANNPILLTTWMVNKQIEEATGGINIPAIMGNDINANLNQLASLAIAGMSQLANIPKLIGAIGTFLAPELLGTNERWLSRDFRNSRGRGFGGITSGSLADTSFSTQYVGSNSSSDVFASTLNEGVENSQQAIEIMNQENLTDPDAKELKDIYELLETYHTDLTQRLDDLSVRVKFDPLSGGGI